MLASSFYDVVLGLDVHWELVPMPPAPVPVPTPIPNPFTGIIFDPMGLGAGLVISNVIGAVMGNPATGPVIYWSAVPATNTGTEAKHVPGHILIPPGTGWAPFPKMLDPVIHPKDPPSLGVPTNPQNNAICVFGSKSVSVMGSNAVRLGDILLSCSEPLRMPTSAVIAVPKGAPILIGGPPSLDLMAAAFASLRTNFASGNLHALASRINSARLRNLAHRAACFFTGHPVDVATGKVMTEAVDLELPGPLPLKVERIYSSAFAGRSGMLGHGWSTSLDQRVWRERGKIVCLAEDGREIEFDTFDFPGHMALAGDEVWRPLDQLRLRVGEGSRFEIEGLDGVVREFAPVVGRDDGISRLHRIRSRDGHHQISFGYDSRGNLEWVRDSGDRIIRFETDVKGRLLNVSIPKAHGQGWVGHRRYHYDTEGDLVEVTDAMGAKWDYEYTTHLLVRETDRAGLSFYFQYDGYGQDAWCIHTWGDDGIYDHEIGYDKKGHKTFVTNSLGESTTYEMNIVGQVVKVTDPLGGATSYEYDETTLKKTAEIDALGNAARFTLNEWGEVSRMEGPDGAVTSIAYDESLRLPSMLTSPTGGQWHWHHDGLGNSVDVTTPTGETTRSDWQNGLMRSVQLPGGRQMSFAYDQQKNLLSTRLPNGASDATRYDNLGRPIEYTDARGGVTKVTFDAESRPVKVVSPVGVVQRTRYDPEGNPLEVQDATRHVKLRYGGFHEVVEREEDSTTVCFQYDTENRLTTVVNEANEHYEYELDAAGRVVAEVGFDGERRWYVRDKAGQVIEEHLPSGLARKLSYDSVGRIEEISTSDGSKINYAYDLDGSIVRAWNDDTEVVFERDAMGRPTAEISNGIRVESIFGVDGQRSQVETSLGGCQSVEYDVLGEVDALYHGSASDFEQRPSQRFERDVLGLETARKLPGGVRVDWYRDEAGRPTERRTSLVADGVVQRTLSTQSYQWRGADQIAAIIDAAEGPRFFTHDRRSRLVGERSPSTNPVEGDTTIHRAMDAVGNVYRSPDLNDRIFAAGGRIVETDDGTRFEHDADGNQTLKIEPDGSKWRYSWNGAGMLAEVERPDGKRVGFEYDVFARRTKKTVYTLDDSGLEGSPNPFIRRELGLPPWAPTTVIEDETRFVWDGDQMIHELSSVEGLTTWYWEPGTFVPIAKAQGDRLWGLAHDQIGTPTEMFDEGGGLVWGMGLDVFGEVWSGAGEAEKCFWRWPGQYRDKETDLSSNRYRYYDCNRGGFASQDPLAPFADTSFYAYSRNPLTEIDPLGLVSIRQLRILLGRSGESVRGYSIRVATAADEASAGSNMSAYTSVDYRTNRVVTDSRGRPIITLFSRAMSSVEQAVISIGHEIQHISDTRAGIYTAREIDAELSGKRLWERVQRRSRNGCR